MRIFDKIDAKTLDRREFQLWILAITTIVILAGGMALLMYPTVFSDPIILSGPTMRKVFFGFCGLSGLLAAYLLDRHITMRQLRRQLTDEQTRNTMLRHQASTDLLKTLPGFSHFQDRLPMEIRRSATTQKPLSLIIMHLTPVRGLSIHEEVSTAFGDAAKALLRRLRRKDSIYSLAPGVFGVLLPEASTDAGYRVADRLAEGLHDASGASARFSFDVRVVNYPDHTETSWDMEHAVRVFFAEKQMDPPGSEAEDAFQDVAAGVRQPA